MSAGKTAKKLLTEKQFDFIRLEFGYNLDEVSSLNDETFSKLYDKLCDIEVEETIKSDRNGTELSARGKLAESIVTIIGNEIYRNVF